MYSPTDVWLASTYIILSFNIPANVCLKTLEASHDQEMHYPQHISIQSIIHIIMNTTFEDIDI